MALLSNVRCNVSRSTPGTGMWATKRKMSSIASVKKIF